MVLCFINYVLILLVWLLNIQIEIKKPIKYSIESNIKSNKQFYMEREIKNINVSGESLLNNKSIVEDKEITLVILNKRTLKRNVYAIQQGKKIHNECLTIEVHRCWKNLQPNQKSSIAYISIKEKKNEKCTKVFSGVITSLCGSHNTFQHKEYNVALL